MYLYIEVFKADTEDVIIRTDVTSKTAKQKTYLRDKYKKDYWGKVITVQYEKPQPTLKPLKEPV